MKTKAIRQAISEDSLFKAVANWCQSGAGKKSHSLKILTAFVSDKGVEAISPFIDVFLADGNNVQIIFGIDRGGTNGDAVRRLHSLQIAHAQNVRVSLFRAPAAGSIFHPKLYIYEADSQVSFIVGSANLTLSGLGSNLESLLLWEAVPNSAKISRDVMEVWSIFANPAPPLPPNSLRRLNGPLVTELINKLPVKSSQENPDSTRDVRHLWRPLSRVRLPRSSSPVQASRTLAAARANSYLLMDVLNETRHTQMQIPLTVVEDFFRVPRRDPATLKVSVVADGSLTHPIDRALVMSTGGTQTRLMRRIEMPQIKGLDRPLAVLFFRLRGTRKFAYLLVPRRTHEYKIANRILNARGQQGSGERRYYIGHERDAPWNEVSRIVKS